MKRFPFILMSAVLLLGTISCYEKTNRGQVVFAEIKGNNQGNTLLYLEVKDQYRMGFPFKMVHLVHNSQIKTSSPWATIRFNQKTDAYEVHIELPTPQDLQSWKQAFDKNEPVILFPKY